MDKALLKQSIDEWSMSYRIDRKRLIPRKAISLTSQKMATALVGVRRCGKSFSAIELSKKLPEEEVLYYNFEDPLFYIEPTVEKLKTLLNVAIEFSETSIKMLILDEIQNVDGWERWLRKLIDQKRYEILVTGSSAKLLSSELSTALSGRCLQYEIWPLSYAEYLKFAAKKPARAAEHISALRAYMTWGGFPEVVLSSTAEIRKKILRQYLTDIVLKDIISRHQIRNKRALDLLIAYYFSNPSSLHSYNALKNAFSLSLDVVADYTRALSEAFIVFEVARYHPNLKVQSRDPKKVYLIDPGLRKAGNRSVHDDTGKILENLVYLQLRRKGVDVFYYKEKQEVDFLVTENGKPVQAIQVCSADLKDSSTRKREVGALLECMENLKLKSSTLISFDREENIKLEKGKTIKVVPAYSWLLSDGE